MAQREKPKARRKDVINMSKTTIVGWTKKKAFDGVIDGRHISSPEKVIFQLVQDVENPECHGKMVDHLQLPVDNAVKLNNGSDNFDMLLNVEVKLEYQFFNGKAQLVDIIVINADGSIFEKKQTADKKQ